MLSIPPTSLPEVNDLIAQPSVVAIRMKIAELEIYEVLLGSEATSLPPIELAFDLFDRNVRDLQTAAETLEPVSRQAIYAELQREASGHNDENLNRFWNKPASAFQT